MALMDNMKTRLKYRGGTKQQDRMINDKEWSLKDALKYSYQAGTAIIGPNNKFRCLMNPKNYGDDNIDKIISVPYKDVDLNDKPDGSAWEPDEEIYNGLYIFQPIGVYDSTILDGNNNTGSTTTEEVPQSPFEEYVQHNKIPTKKRYKLTHIKVGSTFEWVETNTHWICYYQYEEELAYFRGACRKCNLEISVNDNKYWIYLRGPNEQDIDWNTRVSSRAIYNDLNYKYKGYITQDENTNNFFERHAVIRIDGLDYRIVAVDRLTRKGLIEFYLDEMLQNEVAKQLEEIEKDVVEEKNDEILGDSFKTYPYETLRYTIKTPKDNGVWYISDSKKVSIKKQNKNEIEFSIIYGRACSFDLIYKDGEQEVVRQTITVQSL